MARSELFSGLIESVTVAPLRAALDGDHAAGATVLALDVTRAVFDADGDQVLIGGVVHTSTAYDDLDGAGAAILTLASPGLTADADDGDWVSVYDPLYATVATNKTAMVREPGDVDNTEPVEARFSLALVEKLGDGIRGVTGELCTFEYDRGEYVIVDIRGLGDPNASGTQFKRDAMTVAATGTQTFDLTYEPLPDSLHLRWEPLNMDDTEWTRDGTVVTIPDTLNPFEVGDVITAKYAYRKGITNPPGEDFVSKMLSLGVLGYYRHGEPSGTAMLDSSGHSHDGAYANGPTLGVAGLLAGSADTCVDMNGSTQYGIVSWAAWLDTVSGLFVHSIIDPDVTSGDRSILDRDTGVGGARLWQFRQSGGKVQLVFWTTTGGPFVVTGATTVSVGTPVAATYDGAVAKVFVDGVVDGSLTQAGVLQVGSAPLGVGVNFSAPSSAPAQWFDGKLDESAYGSYISDADVADLAALA